MKNAASSSWKLISKSTPTLPILYKLPFSICSFCSRADSPISSQGKSPETVFDGVWRMVSLPTRCVRRECRSLCPVVAYDHGPPLAQIISYLTSRAHPQMRADSLRDSNPSVLPTTVIDQIRLWQREGQRVQSAEGTHLDCTFRSCAIELSLTRIHGVDRLFVRRFYGAIGFRTGGHLCS